MRFLLALFLFGCFPVSAQKGFSLIQKENEKKVEVFYNGKLLTAYCYFDSTEKPILFPIKTLSGVTITRGFPIAPREGERTDHPHQVGLWFNYESVNGLDFWNNSYAIPAEKKNLYGSIKHQKIIASKTKGEEASLKTLSHWVDSKGNILLEEVTEFIFRVEDSSFIIDRASSLTAKSKQVIFKDVKDGLLGLRIARELEMPSKQEDKFVDAQGKITSTPEIRNENVTGNYVNQQGIQGDEVWGKRSAWIYLEGKIDGKVIMIAIIDHPKNVGYPAYWHARGYGLFAINPLGQQVFSNGTEILNFTLNQKQTVVFKYRVIVHEGSILKNSTLDSSAVSFSRKF